jgi:hypothetical protein
MPTYSGLARGNGSVDFAAFWALAEAHMIPATMIADILRVTTPIVVFMVRSFFARRPDLAAD